MKNKYWILIVVLVMALTLLGFASSAHDEEDETSVKTVTNFETSEKSLVYDEYIDRIVNNEEIAPNTWMLNDGIYMAVFADGEQCELVVDNGSWYLVK